MKQTAECQNNLSLQGNTVQTLLADTIPGLTAGYNFHPCKRGKNLLRVFQCMFYHPRDNRSLG